MVGRTTNLNRDLSARRFARPATGPPPDGITAFQICFAQLTILLPLSASNQIANLSIQFRARLPQHLRPVSSGLCNVIISVHITESITLTATISG